MLDTGSWTASATSGFPNSGEAFESTILVTNEGTVTLIQVHVNDADGVITCDEEQPVAELGVGESYQCAHSHEVC